MQRQLAAVPLARRQRALAVLTALAVLLIVAGVLPWARPAPVAVRVIAVAALLSGLLALLIAWGLATSVRLERRRTAEAQIDSVLAAAGGGCDCGHDHGGHDHGGHDHGGHDHGGHDHGAAAHPAPVATCAPDAPDCTHRCEACVRSTLRQS
jgi:hypothetical protein